MASSLSLDLNDLRGNLKIVYSSMVDDNPALPSRGHSRMSIFYVDLLRASRTTSKLLALPAILLSLRVISTEVPKI